MVRQPDSARFIELRALIVIGALVALCVSSNVGPQLLPLPTLAAHVTTHSRVVPGAITADLHSDSSASFRVPILADSQRRADRRFQDHLVAALPRVNFVFSNVLCLSPERNHQASGLASESATPPPGRAPPRLT